MLLYVDMNAPGSTNTDVDIVRCKVFGCELAHTLRESRAEEEITMITVGIGI